MPRRYLGILLATVFLPAAWAGDAVQLAWKLTPGDRFALVIEVALDTSGAAMGVELGGQRTARVEGDLVVGEVGSDKSRVRFVPTRMILHRAAGKTVADRDLGPTDLNEVSLPGTLTARGVLELDWDDLEETLGDELKGLGLDTLLAGLFFELPKKPVAAGDTWTANGEGALERADVVLEVASIDGATGAVEISGKPKAKSSTVKVGGGHSAKLSVEGDATARFDATRGHLVTLALAITVRTEGSAGGISGKVEASATRKVSIARK